ncbi:Carbohydrate-binding X8 domain superfamily protein [Perilla frutescens var. hirtella]|uniref:Carbohydrate-binding X8 domain superfamily protein n=1 Tax=Perilla frutescens var. hirtella TaxID=608512 RepID=A0AAD4JBE3_PERFH|nr:Carbohydrate-binding X8 domain superfamily protein [Perilla frutescens var. hirtella]
MRNSLWLPLILTAFQQFMISAANATAQAKAEAGVPAATTTLSPPEGNTTFIGGTTWCVARPGVSQVDLQEALDWACGMGKADCGPIQMGGPCFEPETLLSHASYAFNSYYQQNGNSDIACYFGGTAVLTQNNPSYAKCDFATSESVKSSTSVSWSKSFLWKIDVVLVLLMCVAVR